MESRMWCMLALWVAVGPGVALGQGSEQASGKAAADALEGPPLVSAQGWIAVDARTGAAIGGAGEAAARPMASTTKIMTAWIVLGLAAADPAVLEGEVVFSERAAKTTGSSSRLLAGDKLPVRELLYGLLLPSGNDAAVALAEQFGPRFGADGNGDGDGDGDAVARFVAEMNRRARELGLQETVYRDPHGLSRENVASPRDLAALACAALADERFRAYVGTRRRECAVTGADGRSRTVVWTNTNRLLDIEGYEGIKTGTTTPAGNCLVAAGRRGESRVVVVVLGTTSTDGRYIDARNLFRWAWRALAEN